MYSTINVNNENKILKTIEVSLLILVVSKMKNRMTPKVIVCKIPKIQKTFLSCIDWNWLVRYIYFSINFEHSNHKSAKHPTFF